MSEFRPGQIIFSQGDAADSVLYIVRGKIKIAVLSEQAGRKRWSAFSATETFSGKAV